MKRKWTFLLGILAGFVVISGCGDSAEVVNPGQFGTISGTMTIIGTAPPEGRLHISLWADKGLTGTPAFESEGVAIVIEGDRSFTLEEVPRGIYEAVTATWRPDADPSLLRIIGVYWANSDSVGTDGSRTLPANVEPLPVAIGSTGLQVEDVNFKVDLDLID